jgi:hypothetical protein
MACTTLTRQNFLQKAKSLISRLSFNLDYLSSIAHLDWNYQLVSQGQEEQAALLSGLEELVLSNNDYKNLLTSEEVAEFEGHLKLIQSKNEQFVTHLTILQGLVKAELNETRQVSQALEKMESAYIVFPLTSKKRSLNLLR